MSDYESRHSRISIQSGDECGPQYSNAKAYLLQASSKTGDNLYDHLSKLLSKILDEKPVNVVDAFEELSQQLKREKFVSKADNILERTEKSKEETLAETQQSLFLRVEGGDAEAEEQEYAALPNLLELSYYFEQAGIGVNREEVILIWLAIKMLVETQPVENVRFWGKILGTEANYIIVETEMREGEGDEDEPEQSEEPLEEQTLEKDLDGNEEGEAEVDFIPKPEFKPPPVVPKEEHRTGANKKTYFVCNEPGESWIRLPLVTPSQIFTARKIKKFFTGRLDAQVVSNPPFPGTEMNYLRAQIARISASTHISPVGYYMFDEEDEDDSGALKNHVIINPEYEPLPTRELAESSNWVHHVLHILPQGRTTWWNPVQKSGDDIDENDEEDEKEDEEVIEPEIGPPLLTPLIEDAEVNGINPWTTRVSSKLLAQYALAVVDSCLWPGAHAFSNGRLFENIYIGWGHKYSSTNYSPPLMPPVQSEYPNGPEISETVDPTPEEESALKAANAKDGDGADEDGVDDGAIAEEEGEDEDDDEG